MLYTPKVSHTSLPFPSQEGDLNVLGSEFPKKIGKLRYASPP